MSVFIENISKTKFNFHYKVVINKVIDAFFADKMLPEELEVNVLIVSQEEIQNINKENRDIDRVTDVLSFPYFDFEVPGEFDESLMDEYENILGDIIICGDKVISQAEEYGHTQKRELAFLVVHSLLHLTGYDHIESSDAEIMEAEQRRIMDLVRIPR